MADMQRFGCGLIVSARFVASRDGSFFSEREENAVMNEKAFTQ